MKIEVWCKTQLPTQGVLAKTVDNWPVVPRVGEYVVVHEGWCSEPVLDVHYHLDERFVSVEIHADVDGAYADKARE
jgi:hypothetical protein